MFYIDVFSGSLPLKERERIQEKLKRNISDGQKAKLQNPSWRNKHNPLVNSNPATSRKSLTAKNAEVLEDKDKCKSAIIYDRGKSGIVSSHSNIVSDDINDMVEQIQAIQNDISELAGRPISLAGS